MQYLRKQFINYLHYLQIIKSAYKRHVYTISNSLYRIRGITDSDMRNSCDNLDTLILRGNQIRELEARVFKDCSKLRELSLSYNAISRIDSEAFRHVGDTLESLEISFGLQMRAFPGKPH